jgi:hypothetical protein
MLNGYNEALTYSSSVDHANTTLTIEGSGDFKKCAELIGSVLWPHEELLENCKQRGLCSIDGILPPIMEDMHFFGMV